MNRFFVDKQNVLEDKSLVIIDDLEDIKHINKVLRLREKDLLEICDGQNNEYVGEIVSVKNSRVELEILEKRRSEKEPSIQVTLFQGIPKSNKMEMIVQKCTELGIQRIVPIITSRTIVQLKDKKAEDKKIERWQKIVDEAAKQCKRGVIPVVHEPMTFQQMLSNVSIYDLSIIPYENEKTIGLRTILQDKRNIGKIAIIIGPEGGFEESEIMNAKRMGVIPVTLGPRILRTETAGFVAVSILMYEVGDLGGK